MRRARTHHKKGEKQYHQSNFKESDLHYQAATEYRERALEQMGEL